MGFLTWRRWARRLTRWLMAAILLIPALSKPVLSTGSAPPAPHSEYEIESAMLYNFTKFIDWPENALGAGAAPVTVGIWGDDPMAAALEAALRNKSIHGHPVVVRRIRSGGDPSGCAAIFLGGADRKQSARMVHAVARSPVLTVGEEELCSRQGGVVGFIHDGGRIRFEINLDAAARAGLTVSSQLLQLGGIWREAPPAARK